MCMVYIRAANLCQKYDNFVSVISQNKVKSYKHFNLKLQQKSEKGNMDQINPGRHCSCDEL